MRRAGILLHPTSLPGPLGSGDVGPGAERFLDWLVASGVGVWQVLPLNPPGEGASPYTALSAFAGNPLLVSPERLVEDGLLPASSLARRPAFADGRIYFSSEDGVTTVVEPGKTFRKLAVNPLDGAMLASLAVSDGAFFARTHTHLYRIGAPR